jgi:hypothetical protein
VGEEAPQTEQSEHCKTTQEPDQGNCPVVGNIRSENDCISAWACRKINKWDKTKAEMLVALRRQQQLRAEGESEFQGKGMGGGGAEKKKRGGAINEFRPAGLGGGVFGKWLGYASEMLCQARLGEHKQVPPHTHAEKNTRLLETALTCVSHIAN